MVAVAVTCIKNGRTDSFGIPLIAGTYYPAVEINTANALWSAGYVSVADASVFDQDPLAGTSPLDDFNVARSIAISRQPIKTAANLAAELALIGVAGASPPGWSARPSRLWPVANLPMSAYCADSTCAFGISTSGEQLEAMRLTDGALNHSYAFAGGSLVKDCWVFGNAMLCVVLGPDEGGGIQQGTLYRSTDRGASWASVLTPGQKNTYFLHQGIIAVPSLGAGVLFAGEYNVHPSRTSGGENDQVKVWRSNDSGATWAAVIDWNVGSHHVRHLHALGYDSITNRLFLCFGDDDSESRIVSWDMRSALPASPTIANLNSTSGWSAIGGGQKYRTVGLIIHDGYFWGMVDTYAASSGIWRGKTDLTEYTRVDSGGYKNALSVDNNGWYGFRASNGDLYFCTQVTAVSAARQSVVFGSRNGSDWYAIAKFNVQNNATSAIPRSFMQIPDGRVMLAVDYATGRVSKQTIICNLSSMNFIEHVPDTLSPVWFVDHVSGSDAGSGDFASPFATLGYALTGNRITYGARVMLTRAGTFNEVGKTVAWTAHADNPGATNDFVTISGQGKDGTILNYVSSEASSRIWNLATQFLMLEHLTCQADPAGTITSLFYCGIDTGGEFTLKDAIISAGGKVLTTGTYISGGKLRLYRSKIELTPETAGLYCIGNKSTGMTVGASCYAESSILSGGIGSTKIQSEYVLTLKNCTAINFGAETAISVGSNVVTKPSVTGLALTTVVGSAGRDLASLTWNGTEITYVVAEIAPAGTYASMFASATNKLDVGTLTDYQGRPLEGSLLLVYGPPVVATEPRWDYDRNAVTIPLCGAMLPA
jgi:hypothetical protein